MAWCSRSSIRCQLILLSTLSAGIALTISCVGFVLTDLRLLYQAKQRQLSAQAQMLSFNAGAVMLLQDVHSAEQLLEPLVHQPSIAAAALYSDDGELVAQYSVSGQASPPAAAPEPNGFSQDASGAVEIVQEITEGGQSVGQLYMRADMRDFLDQRLSYLGVAGSVIIVSIAMTLALSQLLQRPISRSISQLADAAAHVTRQGDYSTRVDLETTDELGQLGRAFNTMLEKVEASERSLKQQQDELEQRVRERTADLREEIAQRERIQQDLVAARDAAEAANRAKSEFLANMSHEIRTPMTAILGFSEVLTSDFDSQRSDVEREAVETIQRNGEHLLAIINDILDLSKIEAGKMQVEPLICSPQQVVAEVVSLMRVRAKAKDLPLTLRFDGSIPEFITTDPVRLRQILINLVGNAIKFTERGEIQLRVSFMNSGADPEICFEVIDTGIGISQEQLGRLFHAFEQADTSTTRKFGGTGLGLAIAQRMANLLGGQISVTSILGQGSTFSLVLPTGSLANVRMLSNVGEFLHPSSPVEDIGCRHSLQGVHVLVAEDGNDNQRLIRYLLEKLGATPTIVDNGQLAVDAAIAARDSGTPFQLIFCDMAMPVLDGHETARTLRSLGFDTPIVALTAHAMSGYRELCLQSGCDDYLTKPVDSKSLTATIHRQLDRPQNSRASTGSGPSAVLRRS